MDDVISFIDEENSRLKEHYSGLDTEKMVLARAVKPAREKITKIKKRSY